MCHFQQIAPQQYLAGSGGKDLRAEITIPTFLHRYTVAELDPKIYRNIQALCAEGDRLAEAKAYEDALSQYNRAWKLIPDPPNEWNASTWILAAIADASFLGGYYTSAKEALEYAMHCPNGIGNPFLHLRLGQCHFEMGALSSAADELTRAYMAEGRKIFEKEDAKYFEFLKTRIKPPASGQW
jgi:tetratricopeptide (TPR) repeat protein